MSNTLFKFAIMGAGSIAVKFCEAVRSLPECEVVAVSSKSKERADEFAVTNEIKSAYDSYEEMLQKESIDCVYIATTPESHFPLTMLCLRNGTPVLCEKAMFMSSADAKEAFTMSKEHNTFCMEAMWSRFLPANRQAKKWLSDGAIGNARCLNINIGFAFTPEKNARIFNPKLGGGAAFDLTVYGYEIATFFWEEEASEHYVSATWNEDGIDVINQITLNYENKMAVITATCIAAMESKIVIAGDEGRIEVANPIFASEARLFDKDGNEKEHFIDEQTENGFVYEIQEVIECIQSGEYESKVVPHKSTIDCAEIFDEIYRGC